VSSNTCWCDFQPQSSPSLPHSLPFWLSTPFPGVSPAPVHQTSLSPPSLALQPKEKKTSSNVAGVQLTTTQASPGEAFFQVRQRERPRDRKIRLGEACFSPFFAFFSLSHSPSLSHSSLSERESASKQASKRDVAARGLLPSVHGLALGFNFGI
jgi:hypothetical protein